MQQINHHHPRQNKGAALIVGLIFLLILTLLALASSQVSIQQEHMAGNVREYNEAFQSAEGVLRDVEWRLFNDAGDASFAAESPVQSVADPALGMGSYDCSGSGRWGQDWEQALQRSDADSCPEGENCFQIMRFAHQGGEGDEEIGGSPCVPMQDADEGDYFMIIARGKTPDGRGEAMVQSIYNWFSD